MTSSKGSISHQCWIAFLCAVILVGNHAGTADELEPSSAAGSPPMPASSERLLAQAPPGWVLTYQFNNDETRLAEFTPADEAEIGKWHTKVSFESHARLTESDPLTVVLAEMDRMKEACKQVQHFNLFSGFENEYATAARMVLCDENKQLQLGEVALIKVIQGNDYLYIIRLTRRRPIFDLATPGLDEDEVATWSDYLGRISVCDSNQAKHPCPASPNTPTPMSHE